MSNLAVLGCGHDDRDQQLWAVVDLDTHQQLTVPSTDGDAQELVLEMLRMDEN